MTTLLLAEHDNKSVKDATAKALTAAVALGGPVHVLVAGSGAQGAAQAAAKLAGVDIKPRLQVVKTTEPSGRKSGVKVGSVAELVGKLKDEAGVL